MVGEAEYGFNLARQDTSLRVELYERDWSRVDHLRQLAIETGLEDRVTVHHQEALCLVGVCSPNSTCRRSA